MFYDKKIKYLDVYEKGEKVQNAGFVRLEAKDDKADIQIRVDKLRHTDNETAQVILVGKEREAVIGQLQLENGHGMLELRGLRSTDLAEGIRYVDLYEVLIHLRGERMLKSVVQERETKAEEDLKTAEILETEENARGMAAAMIIEDELVPELLPMMGAKKHSEPAEMPSEVEQQPETKESQEGGPILFVAEPVPRIELQMRPERVTYLEPYAKKTQSMRRMQEPLPKSALADTKWQQLSDIYPHIRPFEDNRDYLKIKPEDFVVLSQNSYPLAGNSFLLHGYYNYEHLILTREMSQDGERFYVGVPGNFYTKEKQVAVLFGFESFEGKSEPAKNGDFGYYMITVEI